MNERRHAGERRSGEAQLRAILDGALDAVVSMDARGRITFWNPQAERLFGWSRDEAMGRVLAELGLPEINAAGLRTNVHAQVMHVRGRPIEGLYAVGNAAAPLDIGAGYQSGLSNLRGLAGGFIAGRHASSR